MMAIINNVADEAIFQFTMRNISGDFTKCLHKIIIPQLIAYVIKRMKGIDDTIVKLNGIAFNAKRNRVVAIFRDTAEEMYNNSEIIKLQYHIFSCTIRDNALYWNCDIYNSTNILQNTFAAKYYLYFNQWHNHEELTACTIS